MKDRIEEPENMEEACKMLSSAHCLVNVIKILQQLWRLILQRHKIGLLHSQSASREELVESILSCWPLVVSGKHIILSYTLMCSLGAIGHRRYQVELSELHNKTERHT